MIKKNIFTVMLLSLSILPLWPRSSTGDIIFLKDGTREESDRVWESDAYVHFILKGTKTVEVRFAKAFVDHVAPTSNKKTSRVGLVDEKQQSISSSADNGNVLDLKMEKPSENNRSRSELSFQEKVIENNRGISFYDPHRPQRYWADKNTKCKTLDEALSRLARTYGRSVEWVRQNMGEENDLGIIHFNLMQHLGRQKQSQGISTHAGHQAAQQKYESDTIKSDRLVKPDNSRKSSMQVPAADATTTSHALPNGFLFYDPRRAKKYWISPSEGYNTLNEALTALARIYNVPVGWIEGHMGDSNLIEDIHENIHKNLSTGTDVK